MKVVGAGGVVFNPKNEVLLIRDCQGYWCFPKGHVDPGEISEQTAIREILEETGIASSIRAPLEATHYTNNKGVEREIFWFLMDGKGQIELEKGLTGAGFFEIQDAKMLLAFPEDVKLLSQAIAMRTHA